jgi:hypothetical protein
MALPRLTINFLEDSAYALRRITPSNTKLECLVSSRSALPRSLGNNEIRKYLDVPGVYLLVGPPKNSGDIVTDSMSDRLTALPTGWTTTSGTTAKRGSEQSLSSSGRMTNP